MEKNKKHREASCWERLRGKLGLVLMGEAMLSKSLIKLSVDGWNCVPSQLFTWDQTMVEVMKIMETPFKGPMHTPLHSVPPTLQQDTTNRCLQSHPQLGVVFALAPSHHFFWSYFSTDLQQHIGHLLTWGVHWHFKNQWTKMDYNGWI